MIPKGAAKIEMTDGRVFISTDNWPTIYLVVVGGCARSRRRMPKAYEGTRRW
ncbi:hypothetical protein MPLB_1690127 [Mesorhizobium sp. ORS 3324]|nr:hypothetical protein MPLB_1690127 [Mesorhizobium sp. ORS 3324]